MDTTETAPAVAHPMLSPVFRDTQARARRERADQAAADIAARADRLADLLGEQTRTEHPRLAAAHDQAVAALRDLGTVYAIDPTLADGRDPERRKAFDVVFETCRQLLPLLRMCERPGAEDHRVRAREEAGAVLARIPRLVDIAREQARADHAEPGGARALSLARFTAAAPDLGDQLDRLLRDHLASALSLPHPHPDAVAAAAELAGIAARLQAVGDEGTAADRVRPGVVGPVPRPARTRPAGRTAPTGND